MTRRVHAWRRAAAALCAAAALWGATASAETAETPADHVLIMVILKHDQSKTLKQIAAELKETGFWRAFPPAGIDVDSWYVAMGLGHVVTLKVPPERLREVNRVVEIHGWSAFRTDFHPAYRFDDIALDLRAKAEAEAEAEAGAAEN